MDEVKTILAVARGGSLEVAAEILGLNYTTVYRRLIRIEERCGGALFDRQGSTYRPNDRGSSLLESAVRLEQEIAAFERELTSRVGDLEGQLRLTVVPSLLPLIRSDIAAFHASNPKTTISVDASTVLVDLIRGDADVAVRAIDSPDPRLVGRKVADVAWAAYSRVDGSPASLPWVGYADSMRRIKAVQFQRKEWGDANEVFRVGSMETMIQVLSASDVVGYLPCHVGDAELGLRRVSEPTLHGKVWVLYAAELRRSRPVLSLAECLMEGLARSRPHLEGRPP